MNEQVPQVSRRILLGLIFATASAATAFAAEPTSKSAKQPTPAQIEFFEKKVRPILVARCQKCHGEKQQKGELRLDSRAAILKGGESGLVLVPGKPDESELISAVRYDADGYQMPPKAKLKDAEIAALVAWVKMGAPWPAHHSKPSPKTNPSGGGINLRERAKHWSFQRVTKPVLPVVRHTDWPRTSVDYFILAKLEAKGVTPAAQADQRTLLRRVTFDLIGLPPTLDEIEHFLDDRSPDAYERVVERLLASPHYGERWGRHWLDLVRFAETLGHEFDFEIHHAWSYRDYVTRALNDDVPYDAFVVEHIAGDLLPSPRRHPVERFNESVMGTAFYWFSQGKHSPVDIRAEECDRVDNQLDVLGKTFLGLTIACTRCHDHKFDPVTTRDYYAMAGFLQSSRRQYAYIDDPASTRALIDDLKRLKSQAGVLLVEAAMQRLSASIENMPALFHGSSDSSGKNQDQRQPASKKWVKHLSDVALKKPANLFHPWAVLREFRNPAEFATKRDTLRKQLRDLNRQATAIAGQSILFEDFRNREFRYWFVTGEAFSTGPTQRTKQVLGDWSRHPVREVVSTGVAHSGLVSGKLRGVLRSRTFTVEKPFILYRMARSGGPAQPGRQDKNGQIHFVVDGFQIIKAPLYGGLTINVPRDRPMGWYRQNVSKFIGHKAYIEIVDEDDGYLAVDRILFSDQPAPPEVPNRLIVEMLDDPAVDSPAALADAYQRVLAKAVRNWVGDASAISVSGDDTVDIVNKLLRVPLPTRKVASADPSQDRAKTLLEHYRRIESRIRPSRLALAMVDGTGENEFVLIRGNHKKPGTEVHRRFLEVFGGNQHSTITTGSGRLALARKIADASNPLVARVQVNRLWLHHFGGQGIVATPDDFGLMGQLPSHPQLLDDLAVRFVESGWSVKQMHRLMVLSSTYRMSSTISNPQAERIDPNNILLHRMRVRRLEGEIIRDAVLAVSGRIDSRMYGRSVPPHLTSFMEGRGRPRRSGPLDGHGRRSLYINVRRNFLTPMFLAFDYPTPFTTMGRRSSSNVPAQALTMMNNPFVIQQASVWARRVSTDSNSRSANSTGANSSRAARIRRLYEMAFARLPEDDELEASLEFLVEHGKGGRGPDDLQTWSDLCHVLLNVKEFMFVN